MKEIATIKIFSKEEKFYSIIVFFGHFFFKPASPKPLAALRIGVSLLLLLQAYFIEENFLSFFAQSGFIKRDVSTLFNDPSLPSLHVIANYFSRFGWAEDVTLYSFGFIYILSLFFLFIGCFTRCSAILAWFLHWSFINTGYSGSYGFDMYAHIFLFYLMWVPCGEAFYIGGLFKKTKSPSSMEARLGLRVLQLHMCISYLACGMEKINSEQWQSGEIFFAALNNPIYSVADFHWLANMPHLCIVASFMVIAIELLYGVMIWPKKTRALWIVATCGLHVGIAIFLKLHLFGLFMCVPTLMLFAISDEEEA